MANSCETVSVILDGGHRQCHPGQGFVLDYDIPLGSDYVMRVHKQKCLFIGLLDC